MSTAARRIANRFVPEIAERVAALGPGVSSPPRGKEQMRLHPFGNMNVAL